MPRIRLLIADDTNLMRRLLVRQLSQEADFEVIGEASNGREAVDKAALLRPDIVLMDLKMPGLNGLRATERILATHSFIKTILLTGEEDLVSLGKAAGATECLSKGCTPEELADAIRRTYAARRSEGTGQTSGPDRQVAIERISTRAGLSESEKTVMGRVVTTDLTIHQIASALSAENSKPVSDSAVKHTLERVMTKLRLEPRTRSTLVKHVLEFDENQMAQNDEDY